MKMIVIVGLMLFAHIESNDKYLEAYTYLNNCKNLKELDKRICKNKSANHFPINVVHEVYPLSVLIFGKEIIQNSIMPNVPHNQTMLNEFIGEFDSEHNFEPFESNQLMDLFANNEKSQIYVAFSKPVGNLLFAELAYNLNPKAKVNSIRDLTRFNNGLAVLFIFDNNGKIKEVRKKLNHYD